MDIDKFFTGINNGALTKLHVNNIMDNFTDEPIYTTRLKLIIKKLLNYFDSFDQMVNNVEGVIVCGSVCNFKGRKQEVHPFNLYRKYKEKELQRQAENNKMYADDLDFLIVLKGTIPVHVKHKIKMIPYKKLYDFICTGETWTGSRYQAVGYHRYAGDTNYECSIDLLFMTKNDLLKNYIKGCAYIKNVLKNGILLASNPSFIQDFNFIPKETPYIVLHSRNTLYIVKNENESIIRCSEQYKTRINKKNANYFEKALLSLLFSVPLFVYWCWSLSTANITHIIVSSIFGFSNVFYWVHCSGKDAQLNK